MQVKVSLTILFFMSLLVLAVAVTVVMSSYLKLAFEINSIGSDLEFEGNATYMPIDENQGLLIYDLKLGRSFHTSSVGIRNSMVVNMTYADGEISIDLFLLLKPLILNVESFGMVAIPFEGIGLLAIKSSNTITGLVAIKHEKVPFRNVEDRLRFYMQCKSGKLVLIKRKE